MKQLFYSIIFVVLITSCGSSCNKDRDKYEEVLFEFTPPTGASLPSVRKEGWVTCAFPDGKGLIEIDVLH